MNYTKKLFKGVGLLLVMNFGAALISYFSRIYLARNLTVYEYGLFYSVFTFVLFFLFFRGLGLGEALVKHISEYRVSNNFNKIKTAITVTLGMQLLSSLVLAIVLFLVSDYLAVNYFKDPMSKEILYFLIFYIFFSVLFIMIKKIFLGFNNTKLFSMVEFSKNLIVLILFYTFFKLGLAIMAPVLAYVIGALILFLVLLPFMLKEFNFFKYKIEKPRKESKKLFLFGFPLLMASFGGKIIGYIDTIILTAYVSLEQVGIYNVVLPSALIILFIGKAISSVVLPTVSELHAKKDKVKLTAGVNLLNRYLLASMLPVILSIFVFTGFFIKLFFGVKYLEGIVSFQILIIGVLFYMVSNINNNILTGLGNPKLVTKSILYAAIVNVILNLILIPLYGIEGAAVSTTFSYFLSFSYSSNKLSILTDIKLPFLLWFKLLIISGISLGFMIYVKGMILDEYLQLVILPLFVIFYLIFLFMFRIVDLNEVKYRLKLIFK